MPELIAAIGMVALVAIALLVAAQYRRITIFEYQVGLLYRNGRYTRLLEAGTHVLFRPSTVVRVVDTRISALTIPGRSWSLPTGSP
jgi:regulator of protease activity HflC (stomatin/prohibitin superfamily)